MRAKFSNWNHWNALTILKKLLLQQKVKTWFVRASIWIEFKQILVCIWSNCLLTENNPAQIWRWCWSRSIAFWCWMLYFTIIFLHRCPFHNAFWVFVRVFTWLAHFFVLMIRILMILKHTTVSLHWYLFIW